MITIDDCSNNMETELINTSDSLIIKKAKIQIYLLEKIETNDKNRFNQIFSSYVTTLTNEFEFIFPNKKIFSILMGYFFVVK